MEAAMETQLVVRTAGMDPQAMPCAHQRIIEAVLTRKKRPTGLVRCRECNAIFDDPSRAEI